MKNTTPVIIILLSLALLDAKSQNTPDWSRYFPGVQPDSILLLSTNIESEKLHDPTFHFDHLDEYQRLYELKKSLRNPKDIAAIVSLFQRDSCATFPMSRCRPVFRDCVLFYKNGRLLSALKICFECEAVASTPHTHEANCLAEEKFLQPIREKWIAIGMYDLFKR